MLNSNLEDDMDRKDWFPIVLLFLIPIPIISTDYLVNFAANFMKISDEKCINNFREGLSTFRWRQLKSVLLIIVLFIVALPIAHYIGITNAPYFAIISAMLLTHAAFGQLGWEIQTHSGKSIIETINKYWFRELYSLGTLLLFIAILSGK